MMQSHRYTDLAESSDQPTDDAYFVITVNRRTGDPRLVGLYVGLDAAEQAHLMADRLNNTRTAAIVVGRR